MEYIQKPRQKLSLSSTYSKLHNVLWQQKEKNYNLQKENTILNTKISSIKQNIPTKIVKQRQDYVKQKQKLRQLYAQIKYQQEWIKNINSKIQEKNYQKQFKRKIRIQKKLNKTNKKCKEINKKLYKIQNKLHGEDQQIQNYTQFLGYYQDNQNIQKSIHPDDVLAQLQKQNHQLNQLMKYKQLELINQQKNINKLNNQLIQLLALKNWIRKYSIQNDKLTHSKTQSNQFYAKSQSIQFNNKKISIVNSQKRPAIQSKSYNNIKNKISNSSVFKRQPKLKITTY